MHVLMSHNVLLFTMQHVIPTCAVVGNAVAVSGVKLLVGSGALCNLHAS